MSAEDQELFGKMIRIENKDVFVDLRKNSNGIYLKLSERRGNMRKTILLPASGIAKLQQVLEEVSAIAGNQKNVKPASSTSKLTSSSFNSEPVPSNTVYVAGLAWEATEDQLKNHFAGTGKIVNAQIIRRTRGGRVISMGCGTLEFETVSDVTNAIAKMNGTEFQGRTLTCREDRKAAGGENSREKSKNVVRTKVFVSNISSDTPTDDVIEFFGVAGDIKKVEKLASANGKKRGIWIVEFDEEDAAAEAIERLHDKDFEGQKIVVREYVEND